MSLNADPARLVPGVVAVLTASDIPGENGLGDYSQEEPVLPPIGATVRMRGAPIALVVATTREAAEAGLAAIEAGYAVLPHTFEPAEALLPGAVPIAGRDNVLTSFEVRHGNLDAAFADSAVVVEGTYRTAFLEHSALERESLLGYLDEAGRLTVIGGSHEPYYQQKYIADVLALAPAQVRVIQPPTGGSFGGKQDPVAVCRHGADGAPRAAAGSGWSTAGTNRSTPRPNAIRTRSATRSARRARAA